ncbi:MAG: HAMP domain-containing protein [Planctomycetes bacterium]|nr:HAMP domain-containing protein [Planctomycetota bacterium]
MPAAARTPIRSGSLLLRTSVALGAALVIAFVALLLVLRPTLATAFERENGQILREQETRARAASRLDDDVADAVLRAAADHAWESALAIVDDAPIETVAGDASATRAMLRSKLSAATAAHRAALEAMRPELVARSGSRLDAEWRDTGDRGARRARELGADLAVRAATGLLALLAVLFLVHGVALYRTVLSPVARLAAATRDVADGRLATRIPAEGDDEVAGLARAFNAMTQSLERADTDLRSLNATLEDRVRAKTAEVAAREQELRRADKMASLGTLAGGVAHEFNNLLGGIQGCAEDASRETDPAELRDTLAMIERTARRGTAITQNLLRFARPSEGDRKPIDLADVAREVAALVGPEALRHKVRVVVDAPSPASVVADPSGIHQVVLNLATNGVHAMQGAGGTLTIEVRADGDTSRISVRDTGRGIAPEHRERLFEPFFTTRPDGTGLGLSVSYGIVQSHGGRIDVASEAGRGSTFAVALPAVPSTDPQSGTPKGVAS